MKPWQLLNSQSASFRKVFSGTAVIVLVRVLRAVSQLSVVVLAANLGGPSLVGQVALFTLFASLISSISVAGYGIALIKELSDGDVPALLVIRAAVALKYVQTLIGFLLCLAYSFGLSDGTEAWLICGGAVCSLLSIHYLVDSWTVAKERYFEYGAYNCVGLILGLGVKVLLFIYFDIRGFVAAAVIESCLTTLIAYRVCSINNLPSRPGVFSYALNLAKKTRELIGASLVSNVLIRSDQLLISNLFGEATLGVYSVAARLIDLAQLITSAYSTAIFPNLNKYFSANYERFTSLLTVTRLGFSLLSIIGMLLAVLCLEYILLAVFGGQFLMTAAIWFLLSISLPLVFIDDLVNKWILVRQAYRMALLRKLAALFFVIAIAFLSADSLGVAGICLAVAVSHFVSVVIVPAMIKKDGASFWKDSSL